VLVELGLVEQRYKAVIEVLDGAVSVTDVARRDRRLLRGRGLLAAPEAPRRVSDPRV